MKDAGFPEQACSKYSPFVKQVSNWVCILQATKHNMKIPLLPPFTDQSIRKLNGLWTAADKMPIANKNLVDISLDKDLFR